MIPAPVRISSGIPSQSALISGVDRPGGYGHPIAHHPSRSNSNCRPESQNPSTTGKVIAAGNPGTFLLSPGPERKPGDPGRKSAVMRNAWCLAPGAGEVKGVNLMCSVRNGVVLPSGNGRSILNASVSRGAQTNSVESAGLGTELG